MLRFIDDKTKNVIMDDGDLLLSDFKDSGITIIYDQKEYYFIECGNKIIIEVDNFNHQFLQEIITKNNTNIRRARCIYVWSKQFSGSKRITRIYN